MATSAPDSKSRAALRQQRLDELLTNCQQELLQQIIGPFGLTPAMFRDKAGGNVTTQHNAEQGLFAKESEEFDRDDYSYETAKRAKMKEALRAGTMNSQEFVDAYTGELQPTKRVDCNGKVVMNAEADHTVSLKTAHRRGGWMRDKAGRTAIGSEKDNLNFTTHKNNREKGASDPTESLREEKGFDPNRVQPLIDKAEAAIEEHMPTTKERVVYHGKELLKTGAKDAGKQALRRTMGLLLHEFIHQSFVEVKRLFLKRGAITNFLDELGQSLKRVAERVVKKLHQAFDALVSGGIEGFISNLLTFLINNFITTAAKVVTLIRESARSLWRAMRLLVNPPPQLSGLEVAREATKIIAAAVTLSLGMLVEESIKGFIAAMPLLAPVAEVIAPAVTAIVTGLSTALVIYALDRLFDSLGASGTELLQLEWDQAEAQARVIGLLEGTLAEQVRSSALYEEAAREYEHVMQRVSHARFHLATAAIAGKAAAQSAQSAVEQVRSQLERQQRFALALEAALVPNARPA